MFLKVVSRWANESGVVRIFESLYECSEIHVSPSGCEGVTNFRLSSEDGMLVEVLETGETDVYIMNDDGKTIDRYMWEPKEDS